MKGFMLKLLVKLKVNYKLIVFILITFYLFTDLYYYAFEEINNNANTNNNCKYIEKAKED